MLQYNCGNAACRAAALVAVCMLQFDCMYLTCTSGGMLSASSPSALSAAAAERAATCTNRLLLLLLLLLLLPLEHLALWLLLFATLMLQDNPRPYVDGVCLHAGACTAVDLAV
jgi:hypothetical protein